MGEILSVNQRDQLLNQLNEEQRTYLTQYMKRGRKTVFANVIAGSKGRNIPAGATDEEIEMLMDDWILDDYIDAGYVSEDHRCECGRPLRYQYIVRHLGTNETKSFGIKHFEEHTGLPSNIVKDVVRGFNKIDYELDEILSKVSNGQKSTYEIPTDMKLPADISEMLKLNLPLLERQQDRLFILLRREREEREPISKPSIAPPIEFANVSKNEEEEKQKRNKLSQPSFELFEPEPVVSVSVKKPNRIETSIEEQLPLEIQNAIDEYIETGIESALIVCELLIKKNNMSNKRYTTQKPKIYYSVCRYLDSYVLSDQMTVEIEGLEDRIYRKKVSLND